MKRRTFAQGLLACVGLVSVPPQVDDKALLAAKMREAMRRTKFIPPFEKPMWRKFQEAETEINDLCRSILAKIGKQDLYWHVRVLRSPGQHNCSLAYIDYDIMGMSANVDVGHIGFYLPEWLQNSSAEKSEFLRNEIGKMLTDMQAATQLTICNKTVWLIDESKLRNMSSASV